MLKVQIKTAPFLEHPVANITYSETHEFDIVAHENMPPDFISGASFDLEQYCRCLLQKIFTLNKSKIKPFLQYQCRQIQNPFVWLNKLEKLVDLNRHLFITNEQNIKIDKALVLIELLRQEIESGKVIPSNRFNFTHVKQQLKSYPSIEDKLLYLMEAKTEYLQNRPAFTNPGEVSFDEKCELEINLLKTQRKLIKTKDSPLSFGEGKPVLSSAEGGVRLKSPQGPRKKLALSEVAGSPVKIQINLNLNQFVDVFFQLMYEKQVNNKPALEHCPNEIAEIIVTCFKDKEGKDISIETVKTILKPSRFEKRPKGKLRIDV